MLRQLSDADEIVRQQRADAVDQVVGNPRPFDADRFGANMVRHAGSARREDGEIAAALLLEFELRLDALDQTSSLIPRSVVVGLRIASASPASCLSRN